MRSVALTASLATAIFSGASGAFAQRVIVETYPSDPPYYDEYAAPRAYRYRSDSPVVVVPVRPANCGEFRYWNGYRCVDARVVPPDLR
jgi:hypothetical protein